MYHYEWGVQTHKAELRRPDPPSRKRRMRLPLPVILKSGHSESVLPLAGSASTVEGRIRSFSIPGHQSSAVALILREVSDFCTPRFGGAGQWQLLLVLCYE
jgi:hypothetical protein